MAKNLSTPPSKILIAGSLAYDHIMLFHGLFEQMLLPSKLDSLSVCFPTPTQNIYFGGCAGNIAYTLKLLGGNPFILGLAGKDFENYSNWLQKNGIEQKGIISCDDVYTASAFILTDKNQHQLVIFQEGAMVAKPEKLSVFDYKNENVSWAIIAPDDARRMIRLAQECFELGVPYIFDPAQQIGNLSGEDLKKAIGHATILIVNEYEAELLSKKMGIGFDDLASMTPHFIQTCGEKGSRIRTEGKWIDVSSVQPHVVMDPTGCGDAFRSGLLFGLSNDLDLKTACEIGALSATYNLEKEGTQGHSFTFSEFQERFQQNFGKKL